MTAVVEKGLEVSLTDGVLEIVLNQPERRNPMDYATIGALTQVMRQAAQDDHARTILLRGEGKGFCAGGDLAEFQSEASSTGFELLESGAPLAELMGLIPGLPIPVVVAAHGFAMGGGCGLVAAADVAIAAEGTRFASSEVKIGLFPLMVLPALSQAVGVRRARELALTGRAIDSEEALRMGLVHRVLPANGFVERAREIAVEMAALGRTTMRLGKAHLREAEGLSLHAGIEWGRAKRPAFMTSPDFEEGVAAFLERRQPRFA
jgi:enoyl-CoA hydratase/carnithine racemase